MGAAVSGVYTESEVPAAKLVLRKLIYSAQMKAAEAKEKENLQKWEFKLLVQK